MTAHDYTTFAAPLAHPGEHLREDFLPDYDLTPGALARAMGLKDRTRIERVVRMAVSTSMGRIVRRAGSAHAGAGQLSARRLTCERRAIGASSS